MSDILQAIVVSDTHIGCRLGLCPPGDIPLDDGGFYRQSDIQAKVWSWWENDFWSQWVPTVTRRQPYAVVVNGDLTDGRHHGSTTQISQNLSDQRKIARIVFEPIVSKCKGHFYVIRGTEAHTGQSAENEETLAQELGAIPNELGQYARWDMWVRIGLRLAHITHHIGVTGSMQYETTALMKEFADACAEAGRWGLEAPSFVVRAHRHRHAEIKVPTATGDGVCVVLPGWQLKTPFVWKGAGRNTNPQCGGVLLRAGDEEHFVRHKIFNIDRTPEVTL